MQFRRSSPRSSLPQQQQQPLRPFPPSSPSWVLVVFAAGCLLGHWHGRFVAHTFHETNTAPTALSGFVGVISSSRGAAPQKDDQSGWRSIDVFVGDNHHVNASSSGTTTNRTNQWHSQARQDQVVSLLLKGKQNGYFVDLAANDATLLSNTLALERDFHWNGLCIEPNPIYWYNLTHHRPRCTVVAAVVGGTQRSMQQDQLYFRYEAGDHGGIIGFDNGPRWKAHSLPATAIPLTEILERHDAPAEIDYLSLDVEGAETFIMMNFPFDKFRVKIITAERLKGEIRTYFKKNGYEFIKKLTRWGESLWIHHSLLDEVNLTVLDQFAFPL